MKILIVIPAFNSHNTIEQVIRKTKKSCYEILVVDDGSTDETYSICENLGVLVLRHKRNLGVSAVMKSAFQFAEERNFTHILSLDSDLQHDPQEIPSLIANAESADLVVGNRFNDLTFIPTCKISSNLFASCVVEEVFGRFIPDIASGYRLYKVASFTQCDFGGEFSFIFSSINFSLANELEIKYSPVKAIYPNNRLLSTPRIFVENLLSSILRHKVTDELVKLQKSIRETLDFKIELKGICFLGFYLERVDAYIFQCDPSSAHHKYKIS